MRQTVWYRKELPTFRNTLAFVRQQLWSVAIAWLSPDEPGMVKILRVLLNRLTAALAFAA